MTDICTSKVVGGSLQGLHWILVKAEQNAHEKGKIDTDEDPAIALTRKDERELSENEMSRP